MVDPGKSGEGEPSGPPALRGDFVACGGRSSGKTATMMRHLAKAKPGLWAIVGINGTRYIDVQGDAQVVEPETPLLQAPTEGEALPEPSSAKGSDPIPTPIPHPKDLL